MAKGVLLDLAGVVYQGDHLLPGAGEAIARLRAGGLPLRFLTNTTRAPKRRLIERLHGMGLEVAADELFTPAQAACDWLALRQLSPFLVVYPDLVGEFAGLSGTQGEAVVVGDAGETLTYNLLNEAFRRLIDGAEFLALARNRTFRDRDGELSLDAGPFVAALEYATRRQAIVVGKPSADFYGTALASMGCAAKDAVMVGDDAEADVAGALSAGVGHAVLVRTGKYRPGDETRCDPPPSATVADLPEAVDWIVELQN
jgi:HAD superfamily hydrolase (TIGR01458 family)